VRAIADVQAPKQRRKENRRKSQRSGLLGVGEEGKMRCGAVKAKANALAQVKREKEKKIAVSKERSSTFTHKNKNKV
jgi:hypothetical protein